MTDSDSSTIIALSTPRGYGGVAVIRLSGPKSLSIVKHVFKSKKNLSPRTAVFGSIFDNVGFIDTAVVIYYKAPRSYTGEDVVEISIHGNPYLCDLVIAACKKQGAIDAGPGDFTMRAFLNGKLDLSQAEGVADLIYASSRAAQTASAELLEGGIGKEIKKIKKDLINIVSVLELELDFQEDEIDFTPRQKILKSVFEIKSKIDGLIKTYDLGKIIREGMLCPIIGAPNSGKSSLFNALLKEERVIVSPFPGTTRDYIEETILANNLLVRLVDTAGLRTSCDKIESTGIQKTRDLIKAGDTLLYVIDSANPPDKLPKLSQSILKKSIFILNKADIANPAQLKKARKLTGARPYFICSALNGSGVHKITTAFTATLKDPVQNNGSIIITRRRHKDALVRVRRCLNRSVDSIRRALAPEIITIDLRDALRHLDFILGKTENDDILNNIFNSFCIGK